MSKLGERMKAMIKNLLNIQPAPITGVNLFESMPYELKTIEALMWYRGDASELDQFYKQVGNNSVMNARFWAAHTNSSTRKIHTGLPAMIVDILSYIVKNDMSDVDLKDSTGKEKWERILKDENFDFPDIVGKGIVGALSSGDGAWKISVNKDISDVPLVEFYTADRVEYAVQYGIVYGVNFLTNIPYKNKVLRLVEKYRRGSVSYELYDGDRLFSEKELYKITGLENINFKERADVMMAVPLLIYESPKYSNRGKSIFEGKIDDFDAFDEIVSQWLDAYRKGRTQKYIPESLIPRDRFNGELKPHNPFDNEYITVEKTMHENATASDDKIQVIQPQIPYDAFLAGYSHYLDLCLQGIISPATLGIDTGKMASADAQREKKDITGVTRNAITGKLEKVLPKLVSAILSSYDLMTNGVSEIYEPEITFGEYGAPDFDSRVDTVNKAATGNIMSIETQVDELWGSSKDETWKANEVLRIKRQKGIEVTDEPRVGE